jgi:DNA-binding PadR family transcriptional regulator
MSRKKYTPLKIFILGVFATYNKPMSGYDLIKVAQEWRFDHYIKASSKASFYYSLTSLEKENLVEELGSKQEGNRPEQTIYQLLPIGREVFIEQMDHYLRKVEPFYFDMDVIVPFVLLIGFQRGKDFILEALTKQIKQREEKFKMIDEGMEYATSRPSYQFNPFQTLALDHYRLHNQAEIDWLRKFYNMVEKTDFEKNIKNIAAQSKEKRKTER